MDTKDISVGQRVQISAEWDNGKLAGLQGTVERVGSQQYPDLIKLTETDPRLAFGNTYWDSRWLEPVEAEAEERPLSEGDVLVVDPSPAHVRSYDFNAGDERSFDREEAIARARLRVRDRGCRQQVRKVRTFDGPRVPLTPPWLIQDI